MHYYCCSTAYYYWYYQVLLNIHIPQASCEFCLVGVSSIASSYQYLSTFWKLIHFSYLACWCWTISYKSTSTQPTSRTAIKLKHTSCWFSLNIPDTATLKAFHHSTSKWGEEFWDNVSKINYAILLHPHCTSTGNELIDRISYVL